LDGEPSVRWTLLPGEFSVSNFNDHTFQAKNDKENARKYLKQALKIEPLDDADKECMEEVKKLMKQLK
jgi:hypothetical protein